MILGAVLETRKSLCLNGKHIPVSFLRHMQFQTLDHYLKAGRLSYLVGEEKKDGLGD